MPSSLASAPRGRVVYDIPQLILARRMTLSIDRLPVLQRIKIGTMLHGDRCKAPHHVDVLEGVRGDATDLEIGTLMLCGGKFHIEHVHDLSIEEMFDLSEDDGGPIYSGLTMVLKSPEEMKRPDPPSPKTRKWAVELLEKPFRSHG